MNYIKNETLFKFELKSFLQFVYNFIINYIISNNKR